jgi:CubicO group peptidase (beta-lactamase class C family)
MAWLLSSMVAVAAENSAAQKPADDAELAGRVDSVIQQAMEKKSITGLSLAVVRNGRLFMAKGYGFANLEWQAPAAPDTVYQIQSMTKSFTASGIMLLVEEGKLHVEDKVSAYLEGTPESWKDITLRHLLTHTSGIKDFINEPTANLRLDVTDEEVFKATAPRPLNFQPGERYSYSNTNYQLLAMIIHKVTGKSYGDFLRERIFEPLEMKNSRVNQLSEVVPHRAAGYMPGSKGWRNGDMIAPTVLAYGGGGLLSTVLDLVKWDAALDTEKILKKTTLEQMWTPATLNNGKTTNYGFGWAIETLGGHRCISHSGAHATGFQSYIARYPDDHLTLIVCLNCIGTNIERFTHRVAGVFVPALTPAERQLIEDKEPQVAERVKTMYAHWLAGEADNSLTPSLAKELPKEKRDDLAGMAGPLQTLGLLESKVDGKFRRYRYLATFQRMSVILMVSFNEDDAISDLRFLPE